MGEILAVRIHPIPDRRVRLPIGLPGLRLPGPDRSGCYSLYADDLRRTGKELRVDSRWLRRDLELRELLGIPDLWRRRRRERVRMHADHNLRLRRAFLWYHRKWLWQHAELRNMLRDRRRLQRRTVHVQPGFHLLRPGLLQELPLS